MQYPIFVKDRYPCPEKCLDRVSRIVSADKIKYGQTHLQDTVILKCFQCNDSVFNIPLKHSAYLIAVAYCYISVALLYGLSTKASRHCAWTLSAHTILTPLPDTDL